MIAFRYNDRRLFSRVVCFLRGGDSAHCEAVEGWPDAPVCVSASWLDGGVRQKSMPLPADKWRVYKIDMQTTPSEWLSRHKGAGYDVLGLLGVVLAPFGHSRRRWFCSEAVADMIGLPEPHIYDLRTLESVCARFGKKIQ